MACFIYYLSLVRAKVNAISISPGTGTGSVRIVPLTLAAESGAPKGLMVLGHKLNCLVVQFLNLTAIAETGNSGYNSGRYGRH